MTGASRENGTVIGSARELVEITARIFRTVINGEAYADLLELWDRNFSSRNDVLDADIAVVERQLASALPLLEEAIRNMVTRDDLVLGVASDPRPCLLVDSARTVIAANEAGARHFGLGKGAAVEERHFNAQDRASFRRLMQGLGNLQSKESTLILRLAGDGHKRAALQLVVLPGTNEVLVKVSGLEISVPERAYETLKQVFGITASELMTIRDMMEGMSGAEIARARDIREDTVKKQMRVIRDKTGANGRTALISLVASLSHLEGEVADKQPRLSVTNMANRVYTIRPDHCLVHVAGQKVEYTVQGKPGGNPLLNMHAAFSAFKLPEELAAALGNAGYTIYTPLRPGYGISDPLPGDYSFEATVRHLAGFADALNLRRFDMLSSTSGSFYGFALKHLLGDRAGHHVTAAGYLPLERETLLKGMAPTHRALIVASAQRPAVARFLSLGGYKMQMQFGPPLFLSYLYNKSESDLRFVRDPASLDTINECTAITAAQGVDAVIHEFALALSAEKHLPPQPEGPVTVLHGTRDMLLPLAAVQSFVRSQPGLNLSEVSGGGQLLFYTHPAIVAKVVIEALKSVG
jgi:pimeloyl-ACP methyl ester carboxylesterase/DNA-binding CsgD family transcriptional regulator